MFLRRIISMLMLFPMLMPSARAEEVALSPVRLNQLGYRLDDAKVVCVVDTPGVFEVVRDADGQVVFTGEISALKEDAASGDAVGYADFSSLTDPGMYVVRTAQGQSVPFAIGEEVYREALSAALRFFHLQRCGETLSEEVAGKHAHGACHLQEATLYGTERTKAVYGGWHDAGDYGRYVPPAGKAVLDLLLAQRDHPEALGQALLDEVRYELDWLLQMQDEDTGGVYHKLTSMAFVPLHMMPDQYVVPMFLSPISATATGDFAGVCAYASLFYARQDPQYAQRLLAAAERAYGWLESNPDVPGFTNPPGITTGEYGDGNDSDERALAAAALYLATGEPAYQEALRPLLGRTAGIGWADMGMYAALLYLQAPEDGRDEAMYLRARNALIAKANNLLRTAGQEGYRVTLEPAGYNWGSNMDVASHGMILLLANRYAPNPALVRAAQDQLHYLLGQNANGLSYITGYGTDSARRPHHRPSAKAKVAMPGMLVGGPNRGLEDGIDYARLSALPPAKRYNDHWGAYATNEVTIYWNSPLVYLLAAFQ